MPRYFIEAIRHNGAFQLGTMHGQGSFEAKDDQAARRSARWRALLTRTEPEVHHWTLAKSKCDPCSTLYNSGVPTPCR